MKTIVWDVDDVLNDLMRAWFSGAWKIERTECGLSYEQILENPPHRILGVPAGDYLHSLDNFRERQLASLAPVPEVLEWFHLHGHRFRHGVLTSVPLRTAHISAGWVMKHFGKWIRSFNVVPSPRGDDGAPSYDLTKKDYLSWWRAGDIFVDDNAQTVEAVASLGIRSILWPRPWNMSAGEQMDVLNDLAELAD